MAQEAEISCGLCQAILTMICEWGVFILWLLMQEEGEKCLLVASGRMCQSQWWNVGLQLWIQN